MLCDYSPVKGARPSPAVVKQAEEALSQQESGGIDCA